MNRNQKLILIAVVVVVMAMFIYPPFQAVRNGTVYNMGYGWIFALSKRGYMTINVSMLIIQWIGVFIVGGIAFFLAKGASATVGFSSKQSASTAVPRENSNVKDVNLYAAILGEKNRDYYLAKFYEFDQQSLGLKASWNWAAFFSPMSWLLYRKIYGWFFALWGIYMFIGTFIEKADAPILIDILISLVPWVVFTIFANSLYHNNIKKKIAIAQGTIKNKALLLEYLSQKGSVNTWVIYVSVGLLGYGILAAIAIPYLAKHTSATHPLAWLLFIAIGTGVIIWVIFNILKREEGDEKENYVYHVEQKNVQPMEEVQKAATHPRSEEKQQNEEFIELLKSTVKENGLNTIPGDDLIEIYNRAKLFALNSNELDFELSKAINALLEEIKKRGLSQESKPQANKQQEIHHYKDYSFKQNEAGGIFEWNWGYTILVVIVLLAAIIVFYNFSGNAEKYFNKAEEYLQSGQYQKAVENCDKAINKKPDYINAYFMRGYAYAALGYDNQAIKDYDKVIELNPSAAGALNNRGTSYERLRKYQRALEDYDRAIQWAPDDGMYYGNRGRVYLTLGDNELGCIDVQKACALGKCESLDFAKSNNLCH